MSRILDHVQRLSPSRSATALAACLAATALVAGCGGGDRVKSFQPTQIIAFGDESSAFEDTQTPAVGSPLTALSSLPVASGSATDVTYRARYTINEVIDVSYLCRTASPGPQVDAACTDPLLSTDYPTSTSYFVPASSSRYYRLSSGLSIVGELETGDFNDGISGTTPSPIYRSGDHIYSCTLDSGSYNGNWVQVLAQGLGAGGLRFGGSTGCPQDSGGSISYAKWGAKVSDVQTQVNANFGALHNGVLVTVLAGQNDIIDAYTRVMANGQTTDAIDAAKIDMRNAGANLANIITSIVSTGARVVYLTVPDLGLAPKPVVDGNSGLATDLTKAFNEGYKGNHESKETGGLVLTVRNDGHKIVKVDGYNAIIAQALTYPSVSACETDPSKVTTPNGTTLSSLLNAAYYSGQPPPSTPSAAYLDAKAKGLLLNCRSNNLQVITAATSTSDNIRAVYTNYLWADEWRLAPIGHNALANLAVARIRDQL